MSDYDDDEMSSIYERILKAYDDSESTIDYTVVSIGVQTLVLILFVESVKHKLEHAAKGRPLFGEVLHSVYSELSTLGVVELVVYLILKYYKDYNKAKKSVFADVHFCLFYVAIFNAFQTVIVAAATMRTSKKQWVDTEKIDLDHYVAIREEFDKLREKLDHSRDRDFTVQGVFRNLIQSIKNPGLQGRYSDLLVRVNFHSLRVHLLRQENLPLTLKVSDYLKRSEARVLTRLVHVSGGAWLMLTGGLNLIYFGMGMVAYVYEDQKLIGNFMTSIFFCMLLIFIFITVILYFKMRSTFRTIMTTKYDLKGMDDETRAKGVRQQLNLFWFGEPEFVITIIQFMQFGYALALAIVLMYWKSLTTFEPYYYLVAVLACYIIFVFVLSKALPQYTLCTSLGYLVSKENLTETVAIHRLEDARRLGLKILAQPEKLDAGTVSVAGDSISTDHKSTLKTPDFDEIVATTPDDYAISNDKTHILAELVQSDTASLRNLLPENSRNSLRQRDRRQTRRKATSDGVALMRAMGNVIRDGTNGNRPEATETPVDPQKAVDDSEITRRDRAERAANRKNKNKTVSASGLIQSWHMITKVEDEERMKDSISNPGPELRATRRRRRKQARLKARSESAIVRQWNAQTLALPSPRESNKIKASDVIENLDHVLAGTIPDVEIMKSSRNSLDGATDASIGGLSDVKVHLTEPGEEICGDTSSSHKSCFHQVIIMVRDFFLSQRYRTSSHVFGTLVAFFVVGDRVEVMLSTTGAIARSDNTWELTLRIAFWMETMWYGLFILSGFLILFLFLPINNKQNDQRVAISAAVLDIFVSSGCLALLFFAEFERCCDTSEYDANYSCCDVFGSRTYGGLGDIEPLTSLIALRIFRFAVGRFIVDRLNKHEDSFVDTDNAEPTLEIKNTPMNQRSDFMHQTVGTPIQIWERAIIEYPNIVEQYGHFSAEVLHCMLGIEVIDDNTARSSTGLERQPPTVDAKLNDLVPRSSNGTNHNDVDVMPKLLEQTTDLPALEEESERNLFDSHHSVNVNLSTNGHEVGQDTEEHHTDFYAPTAPLIRSIRRCDRKMLPILTDFATIDVLLTEFECVYYEAFDVGNLEAMTKKEKKALFALRKTRGGKGVQLREIARSFAQLGRRIVGHLKLSDVTQIHVERRLPATESEGARVESDGLDELESECWSDHQRAPQGASRSFRWQGVKEDRLRLVSEHYSLLLRFYSDLDDAEMYVNDSTVEDEANGPLRKNIALQWAQTIAYSCGKEKLNQKLSHFGENNIDELCDFLTVVHKHDQNETSRRRKSILA
ncbi:unnamed protein product [Cylindrotheca closterium]|uniref:Uncharacterized protein n=1 Tax=Cylindrotheca closterium TaxID=2856 RepID=A0AAD2FWN2_9STRA|nr:unnamed protein product [Cylindrotheca closterium]